MLLITLLLLPLPLPLPSPIHVPHRLTVCEYDHEGGFAHREPYEAPALGGAVVTRGGDEDLVPVCGGDMREEEQCLVLDVRVGVRITM